MATNILERDTKYLENLLVETGRIVSKGRAESTSLDWLSGIQPTRWAELIRHADQIEWTKKSLIGAPFADEEIRSFIGPSRQVLLWQREHFEFLRYVVKLWKLDDDSFQLFTNSRSISLLTFAEEHGFTLRITHDLKNEGRRLQVDLVRRGSPLASIIDRCAATGLRGHGTIRSSQEFILIFLISLALSRSAAQAS